MELIEQAVFTSAETDRAAGYQVVAASKGIGREDLAELAVWGPSHDALLDPSPGASSLNFHPLPSGAYCVSRTTAAGREYSGRGTRTYSQCLVVPPEVLRRFANNPFAVMRAALAGGTLRVYDEIPSRLEPFQLAGGTAVVDVSLLARLAANPGPDWMAALVGAALKSVGVAVCGTPAAEAIVAGLINCLPPECRTDFSFSTGLKLSSRRPFKVVALEHDVEEKRRVERLYHLTVLDFSAEEPDRSTLTDSWARFIHRVLKSGRTSLLARQFTNRHEEVTRGELGALGLQLSEELDAAACSTAAPGCGILESGVTEAHSRERLCHVYHAAEGVSATGRCAALRLPGPSTMLEPPSSEMLQTLEELDQLVYEAITGQKESLQRARSTWRRLEGQLPEELATQWREQYLRYALSIWAQSNGPEPAGGPLHEDAARSLDVVCSLLDEHQTPPPA